LIRAILEPACTTVPGLYLATMVSSMLTDNRRVEILRTHVALADRPSDAVVWIGVDCLTDAISDRSSMGARPRSC
jgi:hypothetical protein